MIKNYKVLQEEFDALSHGTDEAASKASGLLINMEQFHTFFGLKLSYIVFVTTEQLATTLQGKILQLKCVFKAARQQYNSYNNSKLRLTSFFSMVSLLLNQKT